MALGGGTFTLQNKELPGAYINFVSAANASAALSERGTATMPLELDWGKEGEVFELTSEDFLTNSVKLLGYEYGSEKLKGLRDLFLGASTLYAYRLGGGEKAFNSLATARYGGSRGNALTVKVEADPDSDGGFTVTTLLDKTEVDIQKAASAEELTDNDFVIFNKAAELTLTAGTPLEGGTDREATGNDYQKYLEKIEGYSFNTMGVTVTDNVTKGLFASYTKRMRDEVGIKFQLVMYDYPNADHKGIISVKNPVNEEGQSEAAMVYWVTGAEAGCQVNKSVQNKVYNGEFNPVADYTQSQLKEAIKNGEFVLHKVGREIRVLEDINTMVTVSDTEGDIFKDNQTVRVIDQIANDIAVIFNTKYLGVVPNDNSGRVSLWADIVKHHQQLQDIRAIEDFSDSDITVTQGDTKKSVVVTDAVTVVNAMSKLYMTVTVS